MANPRETKRQLIINAAEELFSQHGYGASMDSISKLADVSKQTVYSHFKTKDALFEICMKNKVLEFQKNRVSFDLSKPIEEILFKLGVNLQQTLLQPGAINTYRNAVSQVDAHPEFAATYLEHGPNRSLERLSNYLDQKIEDGTIHLTNSSADTAIQLLLMFHGKTVYWRYLGEDIDDSQQQQEDYIKSCVDMFLSHTLK